MPRATKAIRAVIRQNSAKSWPRSSRQKLPQGMNNMVDTVSSLVPPASTTLSCLSLAGRQLSQAERIFADKEIEREMSSITTTLGGAVWELPPLILHPFNE